MKEEIKIKKMNSEMIISTEIEKAFALSQNLSPIHKKNPSQSIHSEGLLNEMEGSHYSIKTPTFIIDIPPKQQQQFSISNNIFNTHQCKNQQHQYKYLSFDIKSKEVICLKCKDEGHSPNDLEKLNESCDETIDEVTTRCMSNNCLGYPCFICLDCNDYICLNCLLNQHESHKTNSVPYIANSFKDEVNAMYNGLKDCVDKLNNMTIDSSKKNNNSNKKTEKNSERDEVKDQLKKQLINLIPISRHNIQLTVDNYNDKAYQEYCQSFQSNDKEANDIQLVLSNLKSQYNDIETSFKKLIKNLDDNTIRNSIKCELRKKDNDAVVKSQSLIKSTTNNLNRLTQLEYNTQKQNDIILSMQDTLIKNIQSFEDSVLFAIKSGSNNNSIHLNRFRSFVHNSMKYFKTTSVLIKLKQSIHLTGINMCGLYIHKHRLRNPNNELQKMENRDSVDINVSIYKLKGADESTRVLSERKKLYGAVNQNDPVISIYLSNGVLIDKEYDYMITIDNLNTVSYYGDFWSGSALSSNSTVKEQKIICNSTGIEVMFVSPNGVQSDFDEFTNGLIEGIIFTAD